MTPTQLKLIVIAVILVLAGTGFWYYGHWMYGEGERDAKLAFATRDNTALIKARAEVAKLHADVRGLEDQHAIEVAVIDTNGLEELRRVQAAKDRFISDVVAGRIKLLDTHARCPDNRGDPASALARAPGVGDAAGGAELSQPFADFLVGEASRADEIVVKLTACQKLLGARSL